MWAGERPRDVFLGDADGAENRAGGCRRRQAEDVRQRRSWFRENERVGEGEIRR